jgi:hypothetical protein
MKIHKIGTWDDQLSLDISCREKSISRLPESTKQHGRGFRILGANPTALEFPTTIPAL